MYELTCPDNYRSSSRYNSPLGTEWVRVAGRLKQVTVSPKGSVWGVGPSDVIYFREGTSRRNKAGTAWVEQCGALKQISAGHAGVWGVTSEGVIYYRKGTFDDPGHEGFNWISVSRGVWRVLDSCRAVIREEFSVPFHRCHCHVYLL